MHVTINIKFLKEVTFFVIQREVPENSNGCRIKICPVVVVFVVVLVVVVVEEEEEQEEEE